jgi:UDP-glucose 4-epimerase
MKYENMKKNILITGANGYIGKHLCKMLSYFEKYNVFTLDKEGPVNFSIDIRDGLEVMRVGRYLDFDTIIHLAALVRMNESVKTPEKYYHTNINGTANILKYIRYNNFVFASTGGAENPTNPYGLSKRAAEDVVRQYAMDTSTIFRFYNVTGSDGFAPTNPDGLLFNLLKAVKTGSFFLYGNDYNTKDGTALREYIHVNDVCRSLIRAIEQNSNEIENLAYGDPKTVLEIVNTFKESNSVNFDVFLKNRREGDAESMYLKKPSKFMECNYSLRNMLRV